MPNIEQQGGQPEAAAAAQVEVRLYAAERRSRVQRKKLIDKAARIFVTTGGIAIVLSILAILFVIVAETLPLWKSPTPNPQKPLDLNTITGVKAAPLVLGIEEYQAIGYVLNVNGSIDFLLLAKQQLIQRYEIR